MHLTKSSQLFKKALGNLRTKINPNLVNICNQSYREHLIQQPGRPVKAPNPANIADHTEVLEQIQPINLNNDMIIEQNHINTSFTYYTLNHYGQPKLTICEQSDNTILSHDEIIKTQLNNEYIERITIEIPTINLGIAEYLEIVWSMVQPSPKFTNRKFDNLLSYKLYNLFHTTLPYGKILLFKKVRIPNTFMYQYVNVDLSLEEIRNIL